MIEITKQSPNFIGYEYKDVTVKHSVEHIYADGYPNFGWELTDSFIPLQGINSVTMKFKRDRKLRGKAELSRLQRQFDSAVAEIETLERSKEVVPSAIAYGVGIVGTAFMAGAVFASLASMTALTVVLAVPAFAGWILPYWLYLNSHKKKAAQADPLIEEKYDEIYEVCQKANALLDK